MGFYSDAWKTAKAKYEAATNKKKPGKKFLGVYTRASGIEPPLVRLDKTNDFDFPARQKAIDALKAKSAEYTSLLEREIADDTKTNKDPTAAAAMKQALAALKADVAAVVSKVEAQQSHDMADFAAQRGQAAAASEGNKKGRGMVNFGPDVKTKEEIVAALREVESQVAHLPKVAFAEDINAHVTGAIVILCNQLRKHGDQYKKELGNFTPWEKPVPSNQNKAGLANYLDQVNIAVKRLKAALGVS